MRNKTDLLFEHFSKTLELMNQNFIPEELGLNILHQLESQFDDKKKLYDYFSSLNVEKNPYWYHFLFKEDKEVLDFFHLLARNSYHNTHFIDLLSKRFLSFPTEVRREFYENNLGEVSIDKYKRKYLILSGRSFSKADQSKLFHNLPTIFILANRMNVNYELFNTLCEDFKKTLGLTHSQFIDKFGVTLVHCLDENYLRENWTYLEANVRPELQYAYSARIKDTRQTYSEKFLSTVKKGFLPYDITSSDGKIYVMNEIVDSYLNKIEYKLKEMPIKLQELDSIVNDNLNKITAVSNTYDLYFLNREHLANRVKEFTNTINKLCSTRHTSEQATLKKSMLEIDLVITNIINKKEQKFEKKRKI